MSNKPNPRPSSSRVAEARSSSGSSYSWWIVGAVGVVVLMALIVAVVATRGTDSDRASGTIKGGGTVVPAGPVVYGDVTVTGNPLPPQPDTSPTDPAIGLPAPTLTGEQFNGAALTIAAPGQPALVMFVAHWCPHCQKEVPLLSTYFAENGLPGDVNLYAVATGTNEQRPNFPPASWLVKENWPVPTIADTKEGKAANAYGVTGFPFFVALDANGNVVKRMSGELSLADFEALMTAARTAPAAPTAATPSSVTTSAPTGSAAPAPGGTTAP